MTDYLTSCQTYAEKQNRKILLISCFHWLFLLIIIHIICLNILIENFVFHWHILLPLWTTPLSDNECGKTHDSLYQSFNKLNYELLKPYTENMFNYWLILSNFTFVKPIYLENICIWKITNSINLFKTKISHTKNDFNLNWIENFLLLFFSFHCCIWFKNHENLQDCIKAFRIDWIHWKSKSIQLASIRVKLENYVVVCSSFTHCQYHWGLYDFYFLDNHDGFGFCMSSEHRF